MPKTVEKKIYPKNFNEIKEGFRKFDLRKDTDKIEVGDKIIYREYDGSDYTGRKMTRTVSIVMRNADWGLKEDYCIIGWN